MGLRGTQPTGSIIYTLVSSPWDSTRIADSGWISNLQIFKSLTWSIFWLLILPVFKHKQFFISQGVVMNKPDNSDGSRGQLTAGIDTCHLLQIQSPWTWIRETGQTHSYAAFRTYKERVPVVLRVPSASTGISFASLTRISTSRGHSCAYTRPHMTDPGVLPSRYISIMAFEFCRNDATQESYVSALFNC
jgi:hypothetical protein